MASFILFFSLISHKGSSKNSTNDNLLLRNSTNTAAEFEKKCSNPNKEKEDECYGDAFYELSKKEGPDKAVAILFQLQKDNQNISSCHFIAHRIGRGAYEYDKVNWREVFGRTPSICASGIHHGFIDSYLSGLPESEYTKDETVLDICRKGAPNGCFHGMGHVIYVNHEGNTDKAIRQCKAFLNDADKSKCYRGIFMEHVTPISLVEHGFAPRSILNHKDRAPELIELCRSYAADANISAQCWAEISLAVLEANNIDIERTLQTCEGILNKDSVMSCRSKALFLMAGRRPEVIDDLKNFCGNEFLKDENLRKTCYSDIARGAVVSLPVNKYPIVINYCTLLEQGFRQPCLAHMIGAIKNGINKDRIPQVCDKIPQEYRKDICKS